MRAFPSQTHQCNQSSLTARQLRYRRLQLPAHAPTRRQLEYFALDLHSQASPLTTGAYQKELVTELKSLLFQLAYLQRLIDCSNGGPTYPPATTAGHFRSRASFSELNRQRRRNSCVLDA